MNNVKIEQVENVKQNLEVFSNLKSFFGNEWLNQHLDIEERDKKHPIFWVLLDSRCKNLANNLSILQSKCNKFQRIINKLKGDKDTLNFHSTLTEIDVMAYYYSKEDENFRVEYEPSVIEKGKKIDGKLEIDNEVYNLEILTIHEDEEGQRYNKMQQEIRKEIDKIQQPFVVSFGLGQAFTEEYISKFVSFVDELLKKQEQIVEGESYEFSHEGKRLVDVSFKKYPSIVKGLVGGMRSPVRVYDDAGRIKSKILSKIEQLPTNSNNVVIINLSYITQDFIDLEDVLGGQSAIQINIGNSESRPIRLPNSLFHHPKGKHISLVIGYVNNNYNTKRCYQNPLANNFIDEKKIISIF